MPRRLALTKRIDLSDLAEGWDGCYALVTLASYDEVAELNSVKTESANEFDVVNKGIELIKKHFVKGEVVVLDENDELSKAPMEADDFDNNRVLVDRLIEEVIGGIPDPKGSSTVTATSSTSEQPTDTSDTKTL